MRTLYKAFLALLLSFGLLQAAAFEKDASSRTAKVHISSGKALSIGMNTLLLDIRQNGKIPEGAKVSVKAFMPAMPGMPAMKSEAEAKELGNGIYEATVNLAMGGTWQLHIFIVPPTGKKVRVKTILNI